MKRLQFSLEEDLHDALAAEAARRGVPKSALIRQFIREGLHAKLGDGDPMASLIGDIDDDAGDIDSTIYGVPAGGFIDKRPSPSSS